MGEEVFDVNAVGEIMSESDYETERNKPMPNLAHGAVEAALSAQLRTHYLEQYLVVTEVSIATTPPATPDLCIFAKKKIHLRDLKAKETDMPLTVIEILLHSQSIDLLQDKAWKVYFPLGIHSVWIVMPEIKAIQVLLPNDEQHLFHKIYSPIRPPAFRLLWRKSLKIWLEMYAQPLVDDPAFCRPVPSQIVKRMSFFCVWWPSGTDFLYLRG